METPSGLFDKDEYSVWFKEWDGMPEFVQENLSSYRKIVVHFRNQEDVKVFTDLIGQKIGKKQPSIWFPVWEPRRYADKGYVDES